VNGEALLRTERVTKRFGGFVAVGDVTTSVHEGEIVAFVGPNGAGKTTLFNVMTNMVAPTSGSVYFKGQDLTRQPPHKVARLGIGRTFQDVRLFDEMTAWDNVAVFAQDLKTEKLGAGVLFARSVLRGERKVRRRVDEVLDYLGLTEFANVVANRLSFAQQKQVAIARCVARGAELLLLDEPASGLDGDERQEMEGVIRRLVDDGVTVVLVEHNMDVVRALATRAVFLAEGRIVADDVPERLLALPELAEIYFGSARPPTANAANSQPQEAI
jgi:ABC-type branched-subunit amino acid transport system ATPase component